MWQALTGLAQVRQEGSESVYVRLEVQVEGGRSRVEGQQGLTTMRLAGGRVLEASLAFTTPASAPFACQVSTQDGVGLRAKDTGPSITPVTKHGPPGTRQKGPHAASPPPLPADAVHEAQEQQQG